MMKLMRQLLHHPLRRLGARARDLIRSEDGNLFITFLPMLGVMMLWGGIAVDLMRFESRRATLQSVTDRATLAAANLDQSLAIPDVVNDYFAKSGLSDSVKSIDWEKTTTRREVSVDADFELKTLFLRHVNNWIFEENTDQDWSTLTAPAKSTATQGVGAVEVSLVLDLSGSMYAYIQNSSPRERRIDRLKTAAQGFIDDLLMPEFADRISVSLVPYSEQVNVGKPIFDLLKVHQEHNFSYCVEFPDQAFNTTTFDPSYWFDQTQAVQFNAYGKGGFDSFSGSTRNQANPVLDQPVCPRESYEQIIPISQDKTKIKSAISKLEPRAGTSIFLGLKWGVTLLDPSFQSVIKKLPVSMVPAVFADRPHFYDPRSGGTQRVRTLKYLVLMTDGFNDNSWRLRDEYYDDPSERLYWAHHNLPWTELDDRYDAPGAVASTFRETTYHYTRSQGVGYMRSMCEKARDAGIIIYAISMSGDDNSPEALSGRQEMANCAGDANRFFATSGPELEQIFRQISKQITALRLTQ